MYLTPVQFNQPHPQFKGKVYDGAMYIGECLDTICQPNFEEPRVYLQYMPTKEDIVQKPCLERSDFPKEDLQFAYKLCKQDFKNSYRFMNYKRFKNEFVYDNVSVYIIKSDNEDLGFYSARVIDEDNLYINHVDLIPKYRNTKKGAQIILDTWKEINEIAKENGCTKISLHVDSQKKNLVKLYQHFGFNVVDENSIKYRNGNIGYYMEKEI